MEFNYSGWLYLLIGFLFITSCEKEKVTPKVDENGLTKEITDLVPQEILDEMEELGMPIHGGAAPPLIEETFLGTPFILLSSNRPGDVPGQEFADYQVTFYGQDNDDLSIMVNYKSGPENGTGLGSFIVGENGYFSVFVELNTTHTNGSTAQQVSVISGKLVSNGIEDMHLAAFMIDDNGDPEDVWIENGEGRVIHDEDGFSEQL